MNNNQKLFCQEYVKNGSNGTQAYLKSYKNCTEVTARKNANKLLTNTDILKYIEELQNKIEDENIMSAEKRMIYLSSIIKGDENTSDKIKAIDTLNKMDGQYVKKIEIKEINTDWFL